MSQCVGESQQGALGGLTQSVVSLTSLLGPLLAGQLYSKAGSEMTFQIQAIMVLAAMTILVVTRRSSPGNQAVKTPSA